MPLPLPLGPGQSRGSGAFLFSVTHMAFTSGEFRAVREGVEDIKGRLPKIDSEPSPPRASAWTPRGVSMVIGAVAMGIVSIVHEWRAPDPRVSDLVMQVSALKERLDEQSKRAQDAREALDKFRNNAALWGDYVDSSLCELSVRPGYGCPAIAMQPRPSSRSKAPQIQPSVPGLKPLGRE